MAKPQPLISIDVVPLRFNRLLGLIEFATGKRLFKPFLGAQALPGVLLISGESIQAAATRALKSKVGLEAGYLLQLGSFDSTNRDPRGASISIALASPQSYDDFNWSPDARWHDKVDELPFDHSSIVQSALDRATQALWKDIPFTRALLGSQFTTSDALALSPPTPLPSNVRRWFESWPYVTRVTNTEKTGAVGRPSATWKWVD